MKKTLTLLAASTALSATLGLPAWGESWHPVQAAHRALSTFFSDLAHPLRLIHARDDDDDDHGWRDRARRGGDDDDGEDCDDDHGQTCRGGSASPAPAGSVAPPQNGLFGNGTPPRVQVN